MDRHREAVVGWAISARPSEKIKRALPAHFAPDPAAGKRFVELFTANIRNLNTRKPRTLTTWHAPSRT
jgi:hypothetical protein